MSLRARMLAGMAAIAVVLAAVSIAITITTSNQLMGQIDDRLLAATPIPGPGLESGRLERRVDPFDEERGGFGEPEPIGFERSSDLYEGVILADGELVTMFYPNIGDGNVEHHEPDVARLTLRSGETRLFTVGDLEGETQYRVMARQFADVTLITALPLDDVEATIQRLVAFEIVGMLAVLAVLGVVTWWVVRHGIRPVKEMTETAGQIAAGDMTVRVPETSDHTESGQLAIALNQMLERIEGALDERMRSEDRLRQFVSDASHELRTPVTTIRGYAELYRHGGLDEQAKLDDAMKRTEQEAGRMGRLVDDMLVLARLDEGRPLGHDPIDLAVLASEACRDAGAVDPNRPLAVEVESAVVSGDEDRLRQVIANVLGNALVHTDPDVQISVSVAAIDGRAIFEVVDQGTGMDADEVARATERFYRADPSRSRLRGGSGLGLSIVEAAVAAHDGVIEIESEPGDGTTVRLIFPVRARHEPGPLTPSELVD